MLSSQKLIVPPTHCSAVRAEYAAMPVPLRNIVVYPGVLSFTSTIYLLVRDYLPPAWSA